MGGAYLAIIAEHQGQVEWREEIVDLWYIAKPAFKFIFKIMLAQLA